MSLTDRISFTLFCLSVVALAIGHYQLNRHVREEFQAIYKIMHKITTLLRDMDRELEEQKRKPKEEEE